MRHGGRPSPWSMDHAPSRDAPRGERRPDGVVQSCRPHRATPIEKALEKVGSKCVHGRNLKLLCNAVKQAASEAGTTAFGGQREAPERPTGAPPTGAGRAKVHDLQGHQTQRGRPRRCCGHAALRLAASHPCGEARTTRILRSPRAERLGRTREAAAKLIAARPSSARACEQAIAMTTTPAASASPALASIGSERASSDRSLGRAKGPHDSGASCPARSSLDGSARRRAAG